MTPLASRNLFHDKVRLAVTLSGITFAIVLITVTLGLFLGFTSTTSAVVDHANADLWIVSINTQNVDVSAPMSERKRSQILRISGVESADELIINFAQWTRPDGGGESIEIVGFNPRKDLGLPWNITAGRVEDLLQPDTVIVDELYRDKLGVRKIGEQVEINSHRARVVGFTRGIRSFTTSPYVFTSYRNAQRYVRIRPDQTTYVLVRTSPGADVQDVRRRLKALVQDTEILTQGEFSRRTQYYWMISTGAGMALLISALLGFVVGTVIVAQTIYATTMDHIREFGTLKAIGASNRFVYGVILRQAVLSAVLGYGIGMALSCGMSFLTRSAGAAILLPWQLAAAMFVLCLLMCMGASITSIRKVTRLDPALVFKG